MPSFQFQPYQPDGRTIGALLLQQGEIEAARANRLGEAQAQDAVTRGRARASIAGSVGDAATGAIGSIGHLLTQKKAAAAHSAIANVLHKATKPDGTHDLGMINDLLANTPLADQAPALTEWAGKLDQSLLATRKAQKDLNEPPKLTEHDPTKAAIDPTGKIVIEAQPDPAVARAAAAQAETARHNLATEGNTGDANTRAAAAQAETARHNLASEAISKLTAGREAAQASETARHNKAMETAANPFTAAGLGGSAQPAANADLHGADFLKSLAPPVASEIKAYAEGRRPFPTGMSYAKLQPLIALVGQYDPTFDAANYNARNKARTDLTNPSGTGGKTINALNTAIQHLGKLSDLIEELDNTEIPILNAGRNIARNAVGSTKVTNFNVVAPQTMKEVERAWRGAGGSAGEIEALIQSLGPNLGRQQQREALEQFVELAAGKLDATAQQRDNIMGAAASDIPVLFDQNKAIIEKIAKRAKGDTTISVTAPDGSVHPFATQAQADRFKQLAGLK